MKNWIKKLIAKIRKISLKDFLFGEIKTFRIETKTGKYEVWARSYRLRKKGYAVLRDGFVRVGTFLNTVTVVRL